jgi:hypothetical protein
VKFMEKFMKIISLVQIALRGQRQIYHKCGWMWSYFEENVLYVWK